LDGAGALEGSLALAAAVSSVMMAWRVMAVCVVLWGYCLQIFWCDSKRSRPQLCCMAAWRLARRTLTMNVTLRFRPDNFPRSMSTLSCSRLAWIFFLQSNWKSSTVLASRRMSWCSGRMAPSRTAWMSS
jgi:hypothetical protein